MFRVLVCPKHLQKCPENVLKLFLQKQKALHMYFFLNIPRNFSKNITTIFNYKLNYIKIKIKIILICVIFNMVIILTH